MRNLAKVQVHTTGNGICNIYNSKYHWWNNSIKITQIHPETLNHNNCLYKNSFHQLLYAQPANNRHDRQQQAETSLDLMDPSLFHV